MTSSRRWVLAVCVLFGLGCGNSCGAPAPRHVFVLMLENRSFDHMLGFSAITGTDAETGKPTAIDGLTGNEANTYAGTSYAVSAGADWALRADPGHEFNHVLQQLTGSNSYPGGEYPPIDMSGFVSSWVQNATDPVIAAADPETIMRVFQPVQLPVLNALANEFAVCDRWFGSLPGPTWPNRMFVQGASSVDLDDSPTTAQMASWEAGGFVFPHGTIFQALSKADHGWRIYRGDVTPLVLAVDGVFAADTRPFSAFAGDLVKSTGYHPAYTFIEPDYGDNFVGGTFTCGTSQHPQDDITRGEALIKATYEAIRRSPVWPDSMLILTWDEHGGFYDHVAPPAAVPPGDGRNADNNRHGFLFDRYGPRVPAVVISPRIPRNVVDHRTYDHASITATLEALFGLPALTERDRAANNLTALETLDEPRDDAPETLPDPAVSGVLTQCPPPNFNP